MDCAMSMSGAAKQLSQQVACVRNSRSPLRKQLSRGEDFPAAGDAMAQFFPSRISVSS